MHININKAGAILTMSQGTELSKITNVIHSFGIRVGFDMISEESANSVAEISSMAARKHALKQFGIDSEVMQIPRIKGSEVDPEFSRACLLVKDVKLTDEQKLFAVLVDVAVDWLNTSKVLQSHADVLAAAYNEGSIDFRVPMEVLYGCRDLQEFVEAAVLVAAANRMHIWYSSYQAGEEYFHTYNPDY